MIGLTVDGARLRRLQVKSLENIVTRSPLGTLVALGMCAGVILGLLFDQLAIGIALGPLLGVAMHSLRKHSAKTDQRG